MKISTLLAFVGTLPLPAKSGRLTNWRKPLTTLFLALHESRHRQAARDIARHQHLLDRYAESKAQELPGAEAGDTTSQDPRDAQLRSVFLP
jgi:hypothetical protein